MRAAVYVEKGRIAIEDRPIPEPGPSDALLRVSHCGVCGTDLHLVLDGWGRPGGIPGHEYSGRIEAVGRDVSDWKVGDAVVGGAPVGCGRCTACRADRPGLCDERAAFGEDDFQGAFAEFVRVPARQLARVPEGLGLREAALCEPLAVALHAVTLSAVVPGQRALVTGAGPIGALTIAALRARDVEVHVSEPLAVRRELAANLGAARVVEPETLAAPAMPFECVERPVHAVFECSGAPAAFEVGLAQLARAGTLVCVGTGMRRPRLDANRVLLNELVVTGAYNYDASGFDDALALLASRRLPTEVLVEAADTALGGLQAAMEGLAAGRIAAKVLVSPEV